MCVPYEGVAQLLACLRLGSVADVLAADAPAADAAAADALAAGAPDADAPSVDAPESCCCGTSPCTADNDRDKIHQESVILLLSSPAVKALPLQGFHHQPAQP